MSGCVHVNIRTRACRCNLAACMVQHDAVEPTVVAALLYMAKLAQGDLPAAGTGSASGAGPSSPRRTSGLLSVMLAACAAVLLQVQLWLRHPPASVIRYGAMPCARPVLPARPCLCLRAHM